MKTLDKKQIPQFAALCVLSAGLFGYLVVKMVSPSPVAAGTRPVPAVALAAKADASKSGVGQIAGAVPGGPATGSTAEPTPAAESTDAPPPSPGMRDPFAVGYVEPKPAAPTTAPPVVPAMPPLGKQIASIKEIGPAPISFPGAPALPTGLSSFPLRPVPAAPGLPTGPAAPPLPSAPPPPAWTVTGVLQGATEKVAVLRSGEARRIVRSGDFVDSTYRVVAVSRTSVVLRHGTATYRLPLGGPKDAAGKPSAAAMPAAIVPTTAKPTTAVPTPLVPSSAAPGPDAAPDTVPTSVSGLAGQLQQALPSSLTTEAHHG